MVFLRRSLLVVCLLVFPCAAFAVVSADIAIAGSDSPDPVAPDGNITYTVDVTNNGPSIASSVNMSVLLNNTLLFQSMTVPAGWSCPSPAVNSGASFTCSAATLGIGTSTFTIVLKAAKSQIGINDQTLSQTFTASGSDSDPNNGNNTVAVQTAYVAPKSDVGVTATDSPDPVAPDGNITYTVNVKNSGPDAAPNAALSVFQNNTLLYQSITVPAGWNCPSLAVGYGGGFTCNTPSLASGVTSTFTVVLKAAKSQIGINDTTLNQLFTVGNDNKDTDNSNNAVTVQTAYVAPKSDVAVTASGSPNPVAPDGNITYTVNVKNNGPDTAPNAGLSVLQNNTQLFQSISIPAGWTCPSLAVGYGGGFTCHATSLASGVTSTFTIVLKAAKSQIGINDTTLDQLFSIGNDNKDTDNSNDVVHVFTQYVAPKSDIGITATDSPDPVAPDGNITYTVSVKNNGPDAATNATMSVVLNNTLLFQSITTPAGWSCPSPAVNSGASFSCTASTLASGVTSTFTVVLKAAKSQLGINNQTLNQLFSASNENKDVDNSNNSVTVQTAYQTPQANLGVAATDSPDPIVPGNDITYAITLTNAGPDAAANTHLSAVLHGSLRFQSISKPAGFTCMTPAIGATGNIDCTAASFTVTSGNFTLVAQLDPALLSGPGGTIQQIFATSSDAQDTTQSNNSVTVSTTYTTPTADLAVTNSDSPDPVTNGANLTYTQTLKNNGPDPATGAFITETLPNSTTFQSITAPAGFNCTTPAINASGTITCTTASLASGATASFTLVVKVVASSGTITNTVTGDSTTYDNVTSNDSATATTTIVAAPQADLSVNTTTNATSAPIGGTITYTITVTNGGPASATGVVVTDDLPDGLQFVSATPSQGSCNAVDPIICSIGTLANGGSATVTVQAKVIATSGSISNSASGSANESDPTGGNNGSTAPVLPVAPAVAGENVPAMSEWVLIALAAVVSAIAVIRLRT